MNECMIANLLDQLVNLWNVVQEVQLIPDDMDKKNLETHKSWGIHDGNCLQNIIYQPPPPKKKGVCLASNTKLNLNIRQSINLRMDKQHILPSLPPTLETSFHLLTNVDTRGKSKTCWQPRSRGNNSNKWSLFIEKHVQTYMSGGRRSQLALGNPSKEFAPSPS